MSRRPPSYGEIIRAYLLEAQRVRERGEEWADTAPVEQALGLSDYQAIVYFEELKRRRLIVQFPAIGASAMYQLTLDGLRLVEDVELFLEPKVRAVEGAVDRPQQERQTVAATARDEAYREAVRSGVEALKANWPKIVAGASALQGWLRQILG